MVSALSWEKLTVYGMMPKKWLKEKLGFKLLPDSGIPHQAAIKLNYYRIKQKVQEITNQIMERMLTGSVMKHLVIKK